MSLSARRAWIEIINNNYNDLTRPVALRKESVDRNILLRVLPFFVVVALRKESVDRNQQLIDTSKNAIVALRKESVDRNGRLSALSWAVSASLSARRAWIEI